MSKLTPQDYLQLIELCKTHQEWTDENDEEHMGELIEKLYEKIDTLAYHTNHNL